MADTKGRVESKDLMVIERKEPESGEKYNKEGYVIRVVQWIFEKKKGGIGGSVSLEKRQLYLAEDGEVRNGKAKGFGLSDLAAIQKRWREIVETVKNPPAPEWPVGGARTAAAQTEVSESLEEVPF